LANGDLHLLGTFYKANVKQLVPTNPWRSGSTPGGGNIPVFSAGQSLEIRDTDPDSAYQLRWREVNIGSKKLLIADRNILEQVSWDDLNAQNLIFGKNVTIDGQQYKLRVLTGGEERREGGTGSSYEGGKLPNEWDDIIVNEGGYAGLPNPTASDLDTNLNNAARDGAHNQFWNWYYMYSWMQETYLHSGSRCAVRGYGSARRWIYNGRANGSVNTGWRPVLEVLNSAPLITGEDENLGSQATPLQKVYSVTDAEGDPFSIVEKVDDFVIRTIDPAEDGANYIFDTTDIWGDLTLGEHVVTITATDNKGASNSRLYTFRKILSIEDSLRQAVKGSQDLEEYYADIKQKIVDAINYVDPTLNPSTNNSFYELSDMIKSIQSINLLTMMGDLEMELESLNGEVNELENQLLLTVNKYEGGIL